MVGVVSGYFFFFFGKGTHTFSFVSCPWVSQKSERAGGKKKVKQKKKKVEEKKSEGGKKTCAVFFRPRGRFVAVPSQSRLVVGDIRKNGQNFSDLNFCKI